jgi:oligopeptide/dipeptide ABC transporter ATP-binding protein
MTDTPLLEVEDLTIRYRTSSGDITAVSNASFSIDSGEYFGLVGESGCGKSTIAKSIVGGLDDNGYIASGQMRYKGEEIQDFSESKLNREIRWKEISYIPQSSMNSLDPIERISDQAVEIAAVHTDLDREAALEKFREMFAIVGLPEERITDYPHEFSGGMQQRAIIALALFLEPSIVVADEPTTALDVIMQDQIFKYLDLVKSDLSTSMMLITHDISLVFESCDRMAVMHAGQVAETGTVTDLYDDPRHPYSILLQEAFPDIRHPNRALGTIDGQPPINYGDVDTCTFADRCPWAQEQCRASEPPLEPVTNSQSKTSRQMVGCIRENEVHELYRGDDSNDIQQETQNE